MHTDQEIIDQTNELAREIYKIRGHAVPEGHRFDKGRHPQEREAWRIACVAQEILTGTEPDQAISNLEE